MTIIQAADITNDGVSDIIVNMIDIDDSNFALFADLWPSWYPGHRLEKHADLPMSPGNTPPVWIGWRLSLQGYWYPGSSTALAEPAPEPENEPT